LFHHDFSVCDAYNGGLDAAAKVTAQVTLALGNADQMTPPRATRDLAAALKAQVVMLPSGHSLPAEAPDELLAALRGVLA
jgi:pimeloyl-ACP methyl ester carboxylesterase